MEAPRDFDALKLLLVSRRADLPRRLQQVAEFAVAHPDELAFGTAASIAELASVQPSTLVRFAKAVGYSGFSDLQSVFRHRLRDRWPDYGERLRTLHDAQPAAEDPARLMFGFAEAASASLQRMRQTVASEDLDAAVAILAGAETIYLVGMRRAFPVAAYLAYALPKLGIRSLLIDNVAHLGADQLAHVGPRDALVAISFSPYTPTTVELAAAAVARHAPVVALTDSPFSPLAELATVWLEVIEADFGAFRSMAATFCLAMTLAVAVGERRSADGAASAARQSTVDQGVGTKL
ncbi:sugar isomerase (SIS) [Alsobacter metallidurans]|uniref:Sugar isomerase (SIS) n=1 Tax=Alsobacter metallidurans TaxID=340221 RepID=A0A917MLX8_9HYPH|nr:MurR/RpiR family transcriptional regulator [Alsobacter metallidurans]GGH32857.1 sugar isomerase (SIS) [Alsobacter metallidurans]